jgi:hypothetical protein
MDLKRILPVAAAFLITAPTVAAAARTDIAVDRDTSMLLDLHSGSLIVQTWTEDRVEMEAWGDDDLDLVLKKRGRRVVGTVEGEYGHPVDADIEVRIPEWMAIEVEGRDLDCEIENVGSDIEIRVLGGDLLVSGGRGRIKIRSVHGRVTLRDTAGDIDIHATNEDIRLRDIEGTILAESVHGDIRLEGARVTVAELTTTSGDILYDGMIDRDGDYFFATHDGDIRLTVAPDISALVEIETFEGEVVAHGAALEQALVEVRRDREYRLELGETHARVRIRNFSGDIELYDLKRGRTKDD